MKIIYLFRHAKSSWDDPTADDFDRPLNKRGKKAAPLMGAVMAQKAIAPDAILCSPSKRTKQTLKLAIKETGIAVKPQYYEEIYEASVADLFRVIAEQPANCKTVLLVGHNPGMEELLHFLTGQDELIPTAALARLDLDIKNWSALSRNCGKLQWILRPKEIEP